MKEVAGNLGSDGFLANVNQSLKLQPFQQINRLANISLKHGQVMSQRSLDSRSNLINQLNGLSVLADCPVNEEGDGWFDPKFILDVCPFDKIGLLSDGLGHMLDDSVNLIIQSVFKGYIVFFSYS
jgi:hypothetical protein